MKTPAPRRPRAFAVFVLVIASCLPAAAQVTESPHTVAPGRILIEMDGIKLSMDRADAAGNKYTAVGVASTIVTAGIAQSVDAQLGFDLFHRETFEFRGQRDTRSGLGDVSFRMKWTVWRNERREAAVAVIPYVRLPTGTSGMSADGVDGGIIIPWSMNVGVGFTAGAMLQWDLQRNDLADRFDSRWLATGYMQRNLTHVVAVYAESTMEAFSNGTDWRGHLGVGAWWQLTKRLQLDYELMRGLNDRATDWTHIARVNWHW